METYIVLYKFTDQGRKNVKETMSNVSQARAESERRGFTVRGLYWTQGQYDFVAVLDAPNEEAMMAGLFNIAANGNVESETLRAFDEASIRSIIEKM